MTRKQVLALDDLYLDKVVKIQGTKFDRKRKVSDSTIKKIKRLYDKGMSVTEICEKYSMNWLTVKYNVDPEYKKVYNERRDGKHTGVDSISKAERIQYKRDLIKRRKIKV